jgi:hypothetical protein
MVAPIEQIWIAFSGRYHRIGTVSLFVLERRQGVWLSFAGRIGRAVAVGFARHDATGG